MDVEELRQYMKMFVKYEGNPVLEKIGKGDTSFVDELEQAYGIVHQRAYPRDNPTFKLVPTTSETPASNTRDLVEILNEFSERKIEGEELDYTYVRDKQFPPLTDDQKFGKKILSWTAVAVATSASSIYYITGSADFSGSVMSMIGLVGGFIAIPYLMKDNSEKKVFPVLFKAAEKADRFRNYYIAHRIIKESNP